MNTIEYLQSEYANARAEFVRTGDSYWQGRSSGLRTALIWMMPGDAAIEWCNSVDARDE